MDGRSGRAYAPRMLALPSLLADLVSEHRLTSASLCLRVDGAERLHHTVGKARLAPEREALPDQPYDLASLTKPLAGSTVAARLIADQRLDLHAPVCNTLPLVAKGITAAHLLTHSSGYPAHVHFYVDCPHAWGTQAARDWILNAAQTTPLEASPGARHRYSDVGFMVLLKLLETLGGAPLDMLFHSAVRGPANIPDLRWGWPRAAATEHCPVRGYVVEGTVHDLNCAGLGGVSTHAGLFGTSRAVATLAERLLQSTRGEHPQLPGPALKELWSLRGPGSHVGGWDTVSPGASSTGEHFPADTVGHLGYTGTSVWVIPSKNAVVALLTNRVHPTDDLSGIKKARPLLHNAVAHALDLV